MTRFVCSSCCSRMKCPKTGNFTVRTVFFVETSASREKPHNSRTRIKPHAHPLSVLKIRTGGVTRVGPAGRRGAREKFAPHFNALRPPFGPPPPFFKNQNGMGPRTKASSTMVAGGCRRKEGTRPSRPPDPRKAAWVEGARPRDRTSADVAPACAGPVRPPVPSGPSLGAAAWGPRLFAPLWSTGTHAVISFASPYGTVVHGASCV